MPFCLTCLVTVGSREHGQDPNADGGRQQDYISVIFNDKVAYNTSAGMTPEDGSKTQGLKPKMNSDKPTKTQGKKQTKYLRQGRMIRDR